MPARTASAEWKGPLQEGKGHFTVQSGSLSGPYDFRGRFGDGGGANPEEMIAAAHASCFSMALSGVLGRNGVNPQSVRTTATAQFDKVGDGFQITKIHLDTTVTAPGLDDAALQKHAGAAKTGCPISKALAAVPIEMTARLG